MITQYGMKQINYTWTVTTTYSQEYDIKNKLLYIFRMIQIYKRLLNQQKTDSLLKHFFVFPAALRVNRIQCFWLTLTTSCLDWEWGGWVGRPGSSLLLETWCVRRLRLDVTVGNSPQLGHSFHDNASVVVILGLLQKNDDVFSKSIVCELADAPLVHSLFGIRQVSFQQIGFHKPVWTKYKILLSNLYTC